MSLRFPRRVAHRLRERQGGFTIIEVLVAVMILLVGVLGTLPLISGSLSSTNQTTAREQGTNLARDLVERTREASYANLTTSLAPATLRATLPSSDNASALSGSTFTVQRRNITYSVTVFACSIDDPSDGAGVGDASFCDATNCPQASATCAIGPGSGTQGSAAPINVLGIAVAGGSLLQTVCNAVGTPGILTALQSAVSAVAPLSVCPAGSSTPGSTVAYDSQPDDMRRVRVSVSWTVRGRTGSVVQTTLLVNPKG
jgi:type IV pilus modification protein PilV